MIEIGQKNKIIITQGGEFVLTTLIDFWETIGKNILYIYGYRDYPLKCHSIKVDRYKWEELENKILDNLFRVDYIVIRDNPHSSKLIELVNSRIKLPYIWVVKDNSIVNSKIELYQKFDQSYIFYADDNISIFAKSLTNPTRPSFSEIFNLESHYVKDLKNDWSENLYSIRTKWIREKKLEDLFGDNF